MMPSVVLDKAAKSLLTMSGENLSLGQTYFESPSAPSQSKFLFYRRSCCAGMLLLGLPRMEVSFFTNT